VGRWQIYLVLMPLIVLGGLGFPVLNNLAQTGIHRLKRALRRADPSNDLDHHRLVRFSLQTKIVLLTSAALLIGGMLLLFAVESAQPQARWAPRPGYEETAVRVTDEVLRYESPRLRLLNCLFLSASARTAGFNTVSTSAANLRPASLAVLIFLMIIGGSPASTAGGIKTVTFAVLAASIVATLRQRPQVELLRRTIAGMLIRRALTLALLYLGLVWTISWLLALTHPKIDYLELLFESASACGTVGYSTGVTTQLTEVGKVLIIVGMFAGRLGPLTLLFALAAPGKPARYEYPAEELVVG